MLTRGKSFEWEIVEKVEHFVICWSDSFIKPKDKSCERKDFILVIGKLLYHMGYN